jgi:hypothetical protein
MLGRWPRRRRRERIDPFGVGEPWRRFVQGALQAQARYHLTVGSVPPGPLRERLEGIGRRIDEGVKECWRVAQQGDALQDAVSALDLAGARAHDATGERIAAMVGEAEARLAHLQAGLGQAVAGAVELSARSAPCADATGLGEGVDSLVEEMASLRCALDETGALGA